MRGRALSIAIAVVAAAGFLAILRLTGGRRGDDGGLIPPPTASQPPAPAPAAAPPPPEPVGPEATPAPGEISVLALLDEMVDLEHLARLHRHGCPVLCSAPWEDYRALYDSHAAELTWRRASYLSLEQ